MKLASRNRSPNPDYWRVPHEMRGPSRGGALSHCWAASGLPLSSAQIKEVAGRQPDGTSLGRKAIIRTLARIIHEPSTAASVGALWRDLLLPIDSTYCRVRLRRS